MSLAWGGYAVGQIPLDAMILVRGEYFEPDAGHHLIALEAEYKTAWGAECPITSGYRADTLQTYLYDGWERRLPGFNPAWPPGRSNHEWGRAVDFGGGVETFGSPQHVWMVQHAPAHGWQWGEATTEAWHFTFYPGTATASLDATPISITTDTETEDDMAKTTGIYYKRAADGAEVFALINPVSGFYSEWTLGPNADSGSYNNPIAAGFDTGSFVPVTESHAAALKAAAAAVHH